MELGIYRLLEETLGIFSIIAMAWLSAISADLFINKPLGLAPPGIEFKRAHLYDINPVGFGGMALTVAIALCCPFRAFGDYAASLVHLSGSRPCLPRSPLPSPGQPMANIIWRASRVASGKNCPRSPARSANILSSRRTWLGVRPIRRRSARCAVRSTAAAMICASRRRG